MSDIDLYNKSPKEYEHLQHMRPDYVGAIGEFVDLATKYLKDKKDVTIADFCCGHGENTGVWFEKMKY